MSLDHADDAPDDVVEQSVDDAADAADDAVYYEEQVQPEYGILGCTLRELVIVGAWLVVFVVSFFPVLDGAGSVWTRGIDWVLAIGVPTAAVFLIVLRRFSPQGIRRVGSLGIDQFASVAATVAAVVWAGFIWRQVAATVATGAFLIGWVPVVAEIAALALVAATVAAPLIPRLRDDFEGRMETLAHRNANPIRPVVARPRPERADASTDAAAADIADTGDAGDVVDAGRVADAGAGSSAVDPPADDGSYSTGIDQPDALTVVLTDAVPHTEAPRWAAAGDISEGRDSSASDDDATRVLDLPAVDVPGAENAPAENAPAESAPAESAPAEDRRVTGVAYTDPISALNDIFGATGTSETAHTETAHTETPHTEDASGTDRDGDERGGASDEPPLRRTRNEQRAAQSEPAAQETGSAPFWVLAGTERDVLDERGHPLFRIGPDAWALVVEDRGGAYVVRHDDGRIGYLHDLTDITKG